MRPVLLLLPCTCMRAWSVAKHAGCVTAGWLATSTGAYRVLNADMVDNYISLKRRGKELKVKQVRLGS